jgi:hypothetical protein
MMLLGGEISTEGVTMPKSTGAIACTSTRKARSRKPRGGGRKIDPPNEIDHTAESFRLRILQSRVRSIV